MPKTLPARIAFAIILLVFFAARLWNLGTHVPHVDESFAVGVGDQKVPDILDTLRTRDPHPPVYYLFLHAWILAGRTIGALPDVPLQSRFQWKSQTPEQRIFPSDRPASQVVGEPLDKGLVLFLRAPGVILSFLALLLLFHFGKTVYSEPAALCACAVFAISRLETYWAQSVRYHTLLMLFALIATILLVKIEERAARNRPNGSSPHGPSTVRPSNRVLLWFRAGYVLVSVLGLYTNYFFGLILFFHLLYLALKRTLTLKWILLWAIVGAAFLPWLPVFFQQLRIVSGAEYKTAGISPASIPIALYRLVFSYGLETNTLVEGPAYWVALLLLGLVIYFSVRTNKLLIVLYAFTPLAVLFLVSLRKPLFDTQYFLISFPGYCLFLGRGLQEITGAAGKWERRGDPCEQTQP